MGKTDQLVVEKTNKGKTVADVGVFHQHLQSIESLSEDLYLNEQFLMILRTCRILNFGFIVGGKHQQWQEKNYRGHCEGLSAGEKQRRKVRPWQSHLDINANAAVFELCCLSILSIYDNC